LTAEAVNELIKRFSEAARELEVNKAGRTGEGGAFKILRR